MPGETPDGEPTDLARFNASRYFTFKENWPTLIPVYWEWTILILSIPFYFILSRFLLNKVEKHSKENGLHLL